LITKKSSPKKNKKEKGYAEKKNDTDEGKEKGEGWRPTWKNTDESLKKHPTRIIANNKGCEEGVYFPSEEEE